MANAHGVAKGLKKGRAQEPTRRPCRHQLADASSCASLCAENGWRQMRSNKWPFCENGCTQPSIPPRRKISVKPTTNITCFETMNSDAQWMLMRIAADADAKRKNPPR
eukprot:358671-Chlamydomonas_euryale.AAC.6